MQNLFLDTRIRIWIFPKKHTLNKNGFINFKSKVNLNHNRIIIIIIKFYIHLNKHAHVTKKYPSGSLAFTFSPQGGTLSIFGWVCAAGTLKPLAYTRPHSDAFLQTYTNSFLHFFIF